MLTHIPHTPQPRPARTDKSYYCRCRATPEYLKVTNLWFTINLEIPAGGC